MKLHNNGNEQSALGSVKKKKSPAKSEKSELNCSEGKKPENINLIDVNAALKDIVIQDTNGQIIKVINITVPSYARKLEEKSVEQAQRSSLVPEVSSLPLAGSVEGGGTSEAVFETVIVSEQPESQVFDCTVQPQPAQAERVNISRPLSPDSEAASVECEDDSDSDYDPKYVIKIEADVPDADSYIIHDEKKGTFKCKKCMSSYRRKNSIVKHLSTCGQFEKEHKCPYCNYSASQPVTLRIHLARNHNLPPVLIQSIISKGVGNDKKQGRPRKTRKGKSTQSQSNLDIVPLDEFTRKSTESQREPPRALREKTRSLTEEGIIVEQEVQTCSQAEQGVVDYFIFDEKSGKYKCTNCNKSYKNLNTIEKHQVEGCTMGPQHQCLFCPYKGRTPTNVRVHIGHKHGKWPKMGENGVWIY